MDVRLTKEMLSALKETPEMPDNLMKTVAAAKPGSGGFVITIKGDEAMAMSQVCEWHISKDPATNEITERGKIYDSIIEAIIDADMGQ